MKNQWLTIKQLDAQLSEWQALARKYGRPRGGWIKTLRQALSMSAEQLANRLDVTRGRVAQLENAEAHDAVTLRTLRDAAEALGCDLVYAIVPKREPSLENMIKARASEIAQERVSNVAHTMALEAQSVDKSLLQNQKMELASILAEHFNKKIWNEPNTSKQDKHADLIKTLRKQLEKKK